MRALLLALLVLAPGAASAREPAEGQRADAQAHDLTALILALKDVRESRARASTVVTEAGIGSATPAEVARVLRREAFVMQADAWALDLLDPAPDVRGARDAALVATWLFVASFGLFDACAHHAENDALCRAASDAVGAAQAQLRAAEALLGAGSAFS